MGGVTVVDLLGLIPALAVAYGVILGAAALGTGWQLFRERRPVRFRRGAVVPPVGAAGVIDRSDEGTR
ncbi:MAG: hypothetical protein ACRDSL_08170 [Pseudonocardiaceae bacterium]